MATILVKLQVNLSSIIGKPGLVVNQTVAAAVNKAADPAVFHVEEVIHHLRGAAAKDRPVGS